MPETKRYIDYDVYEMPKNEKSFYILVSAIALFIIGYIFYRNFAFSAVLAMLSFLYPKLKTKEIIEKRKDELNLQFKEMLYSLSSSISAGKSIEMAFKDVLKDLAILYTDSDTYIIREVEYILRKIEMNETVEAVLVDFAERAHLEDINNFVDVFSTCKRAGGNMVEVIKNTSNIISDKIEIKQDIDTMLAERRFEQKVLNAMPIFLILVLSMTANDYISPVFTTIIGKIVMTAAIALLAVAYFISKKIMNIKV